MKIITLFTLFTITSLAHAEKPFVYGEILGRMGNYLFEVATTCAVAWDNGATPFFPHLEELRPSNPLRKRVLFRCNRVAPKRVAINQEWTTPAIGYKPIEYSPNMVIKGYCQSMHYFAHHRDRLQKLFAPHPRDLRTIKKKYKHIVNHPNTTSIHVRHYHAEVPGDSFLQFETEYYQKAMSLFPRSTLFVVTSDDIPYAKTIIPQENRQVIFIENELFTVDFHLQRLCKNNIIANSSFSWWSAWLNENPDKIVVRPNRWLEGYENIDSPTSWIRVNASCYQDLQK